MFLTRYFFWLSTLEFATKRDLKNVLRKLDGTELNGKRIKFIDVSIIFNFLVLDLKYIF